MKHLFVFKTILAFVSTCLIASCEANLSPNVNSITNNDLEERKEVSEILGTVLANDSNSQALVSLILKYGGNKESLTFEEISSIKNKNSVDAINSEIIGNAVATELLSNNAVYPISANKTILEPATKNTNEITENLNNLDVELYIPYSEYFDIDNQKGNRITIVYTPEDEFATQTFGIMIENNKRTSVLVDDNYMKENLTLIVMPRDTTSYTKTFSDEEFEKLNSIYNNSVETIIPSKTFIPNGLLRKNITNSADIGEEDILTTTIARLRVNNTSWAATFTNKLKLAIYRTSADYSIDDDGAPVIEPGNHKIGTFPILKKDIRQKKWISLNVTFDDDWDLHEYDQELFFCSEHLLVLKKLDLSGSVSLGFSNGVASAEISASVDFSFKVNASRLRANNELTRKAILATNVSNIGSGVLNIDGTNFAIRNYGGVVDLVFNMYYTDYK